MKWILPVVVSVLLFAWIPVSQGQEGPPQSAPAATQVAPAAESAPVSLEGKVLATYDNSEFMLKADSKYFVVQIGKEYWQLGIARGDVVGVKGVMKPKSLLKNEVVASQVAIVKKSTFEDPPLGLRTIEEVVEHAGEGDLVAVRGKVSGFEKFLLRLSGDRGRVYISFGDADPRTAYIEGDDLVVLGTVRKVLGERAIDAIVVRPASMFKRRGEPTTAQSIKALLKNRPVGKLVKARGRIALFIGKTNATLIYEGKDLLIVYPAQKYLSVDAPAGAEVTVVGTFDIEQQRGREHGVLREARIDRVTLDR